MVREIIELGSSPVEEKCVQVSDKNDYIDEMYKECQRYKKMLESWYPECCFIIKSNPHDFGVYYEVCVVYHEGDEEELDNALEVEANMPLKWDSPKPENVGKRKEMKKTVKERLKKYGLDEDSISEFMEGVYMTIKELFEMSEDELEEEINANFCDQQ